MRANHLALAAAVLLATLSGCATEPISSYAAKPVSMENQLLYQVVTPDTVPVTIVRDQGFVAQGCAARVLVNDQVAAYVRAGEKVTLHIPPGEVILGADINTGGLCQSTGLAEIEANLQPGRPSALDAGGFLVQPGRPRTYRIGFTADGAIGLYRTVDR